MRPIHVTMNYAYRDYGNQTSFVDASGSPLVSGKQSTSLKAEPNAGVSVHTTPLTFGKLQSFNAHMNSLAKSIRVGDSVMKEIGGLLEEMKEALEAVVKSYPPFPRGSEERVKYLESYTGLKAQIDQLTMPPKDEGARGILADLEITGKAGDWKGSAGVGGELPGTVKARQGHAGPGALNIPVLPQDADDDQILAALEKIGKSRETLDVKRNELAEDVEKLKPLGDFHATWKKTSPSYGEEMKAAEEEEFFADRTSADVKYSLSSQWGLTLTETQTTLARFLG